VAKQPCAFCPAPATTKEHLWGDWYNSLFGKDNRYLMKQSTEGEVRSWKSVGLNQKFPVLCNACNNEWGSSLETGMKNASAEMIKDGATTVLNAERISAIALYSQMKAFVCDYGQKHVAPFHDSHARQEFREDLIFPTGTQVWIARTTPMHGVFKGGYFKPSLSTPRRFQGYVFTISLGHLAIQVTCVRWTKKSNRKYLPCPLLTQGSIWNKLSIPIFPNCILPVIWPPLELLSQDLLDEFINRWKTLNVPIGV